MINIEYAWPLYGAGEEYFTERKFTGLNHYGICGRDDRSQCPCCWSHLQNETLTSWQCPQCYMGWKLTKVNRQVCKATRAYAEEQYAPLWQNDDTNWNEDSDNEDLMMVPQMSIFLIVRG
jgi:hypothetical protein